MYMLIYTCLAPGRSSASAGRSPRKHRRLRDLGRPAPEKSNNSTTHLTNVAKSKQQRHNGLRESEPRRSDGSSASRTATTSAAGGRPGPGWSGPGGSGLGTWVRLTANLPTKIIPAKIC